MPKSAKPASDDGKRYVVYLALPDRVKVYAFKTREAAEQYLSGIGIRCWIVGTRPNSGALFMCEGRVSTFVYGGRFRKENCQAVTTLAGQHVELNPYSLRTYSTRRAALADCKGRARQALKHAVGRAKEATVRLKAAQSALAKVLR